MRYKNFRDQFINNRKLKVFILLVLLIVIALFLWQRSQELPLGTDSGAGEQTNIGNADIDTNASQTPQAQAVAEQISRAGWPLAVEYDELITVDTRSKLEAIFSATQPAQIIGGDFACPGNGSLLLPYLIGNDPWCVGFDTQKLAAKSVKILKAIPLTF